MTYRPRSSLGHRQSHAEWRRQCKIAALVLISLGAFHTPAFAQGPKPSVAWATWKEHATALEQYGSTPDLLAATVTIGSRLANANVPQDSARFNNFASALLKHSLQAGSLWSSKGGRMIAATLMTADSSYSQIIRIRPRFIQLSHELKQKRDPQSEVEFRSYTNLIATWLKQTDREVEKTYEQLRTFAADCGVHENVVGRFSESTRAAIEAFYGADPPDLQRVAYEQGLDAALLASARVLLKQMQQMQRERFFAFFAPWDAQHGRVVAAGTVVQDDWRRIHTATKRVADFVSSSEFGKVVPETDAENAMEALEQINTDLATYR